MNFLKKFWNWLVVSSADETKTAMSVKGFLGVIIAGLVATSPLTHIRVGSDQLNAVADQIVQIVSIGASIISGIVMIAGIWRKIVLLVKQWGQ